jgi:hypothetical protein
MVVVTALAVNAIAFSQTPTPDDFMQTLTVGVLMLFATVGMVGIAVILVLYYVTKADIANTKKEMARQKSTSGKGPVVYCKYCGHENSVDANFCQRCGRALK